MSLYTIGEELVKAKIIENEERLKELNLVVKSLKIPAHYSNVPRTQEYYDKTMDALNIKTEKYLKYVEHNLRQSGMLSWLVPPLGKFGQ